MLRIGITGNIASGKSAAEDFIRESGFKVYDTDKIAHNILENSEEAKRAFSEFDIFSNGKIDRKKLAKIVFSDKKQLEKLENIIQPEVKKEILKIFSLCKNEKAIFVSVPQLFEAGFESLFDKIIFISAEKSIRLARLMKRNNLTEKEALLRINAQQDEDKKIIKSDYIIENNSTQESLQNHIKIFLSSIK